LIFNQLQDGILVVDRRGYLVDFNSAAKEYLAFSGGLSPGKLFDLQKLKIAGLKEFDKVGKEKMLQSEVNGVLCQIMSFGLFDYRGDLYGHLVSIRDISGEVEKEKLKEAEIIRKSAWEERMHLARSLHDSVLQNVGGLIMLAGSARQCLDEQLPHEIATLVGQIETGARLAYQDLRLLIDELQLNSAAETEFDLLKTLAAKIDVLKAQGSSDIVFEAPSNLLLDAGRQREVFYIIIEALNNALKYADAKIVRVRIWHSEGVIVGEIEDGGNGFDLRQKRNTGMGMQNMQSRARLMGGQLAIISVPGEGTRVRLEIPVSLPISSEIDKREQPI